MLHTTAHDSRIAGRPTRLSSDRHPRVRVPRGMHPWVLCACHVSVFCRLGVHRTLQMAERFSWGVDVERLRLLVSSLEFGLPTSQDFASDSQVGRAHHALAEGSRPRRWS